MKTLLLLHVLLLFMSLADVASKFAAGYDFASIGFIVCYALVLIILAVIVIGILRTWLNGRKEVRP